MYLNPLLTNILGDIDVLLDDVYIICVEHGSQLSEVLLDLYLLALVWVFRLL